MVEDGATNRYYHRPPVGSEHDDSGGTTSEILKLVFRQGMIHVAWGLAIGLAASLAITRILTSALVRLSPADPVTYVVASVVLIVSAALGCLIPARRAMRVDPVVALRQG